MTLTDARRVLEELERELSASRDAVLEAQGDEEVADLLLLIEGKIAEARTLLAMLERLPTSKSGS